MALTSSAPLTPLENLLNTIASEAAAATQAVADDLEDALEVRQIQSFRTTTLTALNAVTGATDGDRGYVTGSPDTGEYVRSGGAWVKAGASQVVLAMLKTANQTLPTVSVDAAVTWSEVMLDTHNAWNAAQPSRIIAPVDGFYEIAYVMYINSTTGWVQSAAQINGSALIPASAMRYAANSNTGSPLSMVFSVRLTAGEYVEILARSSDTTSRIVTGSPTSALSTAFTMKKIAD